MSGLYNSSISEQEKDLHEWTNELQTKAQAEDRRLEAMERTKMEREDSRSQSHETWDIIWERQVLFPKLLGAAA